MNIDFACDDVTVAEFFPPLPASECIPDWYKKIPMYIDGHKLNGKELSQAGADKQPQTVRSCIPVLDYLSSGYVIRAHADIAITPEEIGDEHGWWYASPNAECIPHPYAQCPVHMGKGKNAYFKVVSPWRIKTPPGYACLFYQPYYNLEDKFQLFPAVVDTDGYTHASINFPGVVLSTESFVIKAGSPLMVVLPFKRDHWKSTTRVESAPKTNPVRLFLARGYKKLFHVKKSFK